jgi:hypothetical protein
LPPLESPADDAHVTCPQDPDMKALKALKEMKGAGVTRMPAVHKTST